MKKQIVFPIDDEAILNKTFSENCVNPGIGGSQFATIILAFALAKKYKNYDIWLLSRAPIKIQNAPKNLKQILTKEIFLLKDEPFNSLNTVIISKENEIEEIELKLFNKFVNYKLINWIHHPFQILNNYKHNIFSAHVSVGIYQYYSNFAWYKPHWHIPVIFNAPVINYLKKKLYKPNESLRLVFLGALVPAKGFHYVAKSWPKILKLFPNAQLDVIGSTETYDGKKTQYKKIPTTDQYAKIILQYISEKDIKTKRVIFHGNLGKEKFKIIKKAHFALLNPTGSSEAMPISCLECLSCGTPVIASDDYGMGDFMRHFPELSIRKPDDIAFKIKSITRNPLLYKKLKTRCVKLGKLYAKQKPKILIKWRQLIEAVISNNIKIYKLPIKRFYGNRLILVIRIIKTLLIIYLKKIKINCLKIY